MIDEVNDTIVKLIRVESTDTHTIGILKVNDEVLCFTLEEPWKQNEANVSCIPCGWYKLELQYSPSMKRKLWTVTNVPERSYIRIHIGNTTDDIEGCILLGMGVGEINGKRAVLNSGNAVHEFMKKLEDKQEVWIAIEKED
jgi:hypothetical protein